MLGVYHTPLMQTGSLHDINWRRNASPVSWFPWSQLFICATVHLMTTSWQFRSNVHRLIFALCVRQVNVACCVWSKNVSVLVGPPQGVDFPACFHVSICQSLDKTAVSLGLRREASGKAALLLTSKENIISPTNTVMCSQSTSNRRNIKIR